MSEPNEALTYGATLPTKRILLIIGGGIAAYKSLDLIRRLRERGIAVRVVMTAAVSIAMAATAPVALAHSPSPRLGALDAGSQWRSGQR